MILNKEHLAIRETVSAFIEKEIKEQTLSLMKDIKKQFDPKNILNPNKSI